MDCVYYIGIISNYIQMPKVIIVTGGAGFLGRNLCKKLLQDENNRVICIDNLVTGHTKNITEFTENFKFRFIEHDITDPEFSTTFAELLPVNVDEIYHLACIASPPKYKEYSIETLMTSFVGTKNVLDLAKRYNAKVLFTSTSEVYGDPLVHPQPEEYFGNVNTFGERSCYDEGKRVAETLIYEYRRKFGLDVKIVRIFNTYGPYMDIDDGRVITNFIKQIIANKPLVIYGDGTQGRSFCYVDDMIDGLFRLMNSAEHGPINIGNPNTEFTLNELVGQFEGILGRNLDVAYIEATENDPKQRKPIIEKAQRLLGWGPVVGLTEGLEKTMKYFGLY
jgi:UDP-glucuronate decarboxylase